MDHLIKEFLTALVGIQKREKEIDPSGSKVAPRFLVGIKQVRT